MATSRNKSIRTTGKCGLTITKTMEQKSSPELKIKSFTSRRKHLIKPFEIPMSKTGDQDKSEYFRSKSFANRATFPSRGGALKWIRDNGDTIDTLVQLLQIHPNLLQNKTLEKFLNFLHAYRFQTNSRDTCLFDESRKNVNLKENIPTITVTSEAFNRRSDNSTTKLLVVGKQMFEKMNGSCSDLISGLSNHFSVHCQSYVDGSNANNLTENVNACLFMITDSSFHELKFLTLLQQMKQAEIPLVFVKTNDLKIPDHIKRHRSMSSCSAAVPDRFSPISLPLPPICYTPNHLTIDSVPDCQDSLLLDGCKKAIIFSQQDTIICIHQICNRLNGTTHDQTSYQDNSNHENTCETLDTEMDSMSISDSVNYQNSSENLSVYEQSFFKKTVETNTFGASLIVMEHMTNYNRNQNNINFKSSADQKNMLGLPTLAARSPPLSPVFKIRNRRTKIKQNPTHYRTDARAVMVSSGSPDSTTDDTTYILFPTKDGQNMTKIVNWPRDAKSLPNDDCLSTDSSVSGFQDIDFSSSLWSSNSDEEQY